LSRSHAPRPGRSAGAASGGCASLDPVAALNLEIAYENSDEVIIGSDPHDYPGISFAPVWDPKAGKNGLHIDIDPDGQGAEVE
jgi:hypothetical protein